MVVMDRDDYNSKTEELLHQQTYRSIPSDPTNKLKKQTHHSVKEDQDRGWVKMRPPIKGSTPQWQDPPNFYGLPKVHKWGTPLRPIVSSIGAATYQTAKELSRILKPLVGRSRHHIHNNQDFLQDLKSIQLASDEVMMSFDVKATIYFSVYWTSIKNHREAPQRRSQPPEQNHHVHTTYHGPPGVMSEEYILHL